MISLPDIPPGSFVALDTETSGLYVDDGARISVASIAWFEGGVLPELKQFRWPQRDGSHLLPPFAPSLQLHSRVYPFDHGIDTPLGFKTDLPPAVQKSRKRRLQPSLLQEDDAGNLPPEDYQTLMEWLASMRLIYHNAKFDMHIMHAGLRGYEDRRHELPDLLPSLYWDTQLMCLVLWPEEQSSLKPTSARLFGVQEAEPQRRLNQWLQKHGMRFDLAPWDLLSPYAAQDAELTLRLALVQFLAMREGGLIPPSTASEIARRELDLCATLTRMEQRGVGYDTEGSLLQADLAVRQADDKHREIVKIVRERLADLPDASPSTAIAATVRVTPDGMRQFWFSDPPEGLGVFPPKVLDSGQPSVDKEVLDVLAKREIPAAKEYREFTQLEKAASMFYKGYADLAGPPHHAFHKHLGPQANTTTYYTHSDKVVEWDGSFTADRRWRRLRTNFNQGRAVFDTEGGTVSGRLAVSRWQAQAIPHDYQIPNGLVTPRQLLRADPGYEVWEVDLSQAEFRTAAAVADCTLMIENFRRGLDVHDSTTDAMFGTSKDDPEFFFHRQVSKRLGFGMLYGAGAFTVGRQIEQFTGRSVGSAQITEWLNDYKRTYPELVRASKRAEMEATRTRYVTLAGGRKRWFSPVDQEYKAFNAKIQGGVAEMMKVAMVEIERQLPGVLLLQVHDSVWVEVERYSAPVQVAAVRAIMEGVFQREFGVPFRADAKCVATDGTYPVPKAEKD